ncbi:MAG: hypothetical protein JKY80_02720 [Mariprofundaceae bacterium]|nr:hypothetical protein [Mariprofundaceae bacterium]
MHKLDLQAMLPHRKPMLMISEVLSYDDQQLEALSLIEPANPLLQDGGRFPGFATLELLAQASGLFLGLNMDGSAEPGAIVSVRNMQVFKSSLGIDKPIHVKINFLGGSGSAAMFQGLAYQEGVLVSDATLTVSQFKEGEADA